jgi:SAM-dependent methyltransferase
MVDIADGSRLAHIVRMAHEPRTIDDAPLGPPLTPATGKTRPGVRARLLLSSALMLFLELALIRWTASNVVHLGYFSNFVLLGSFLGVGLGFLRSDRSSRAPLYFPVVLSLLVVGILLFPVTVDRAGSQLVFFTSLTTTGPPEWVVLPLIFVGVAAVMAGPGELVGRCFSALPRLESYRLDLLGSLAGIVAFTALSLLRAPSVAWGAVVTVLVVVLLGTRRRLFVVGVPMIAVLIALTIESTGAGISWSPYYKVLTHETGTGGDRVIGVAVNGVPHQAAMDAETKAQREAIYARPYERRTSTAPGRVLIVGAGTGTDVALALSRGATSIDAVEIDPRLQQIGAQRHPNRPYDDPRVHVHIDDGRAFLERNHATFDLIIFALPDSLALVAGASSLRLESYLFTVEAMRSVRRHLAPGGSFSMYNFYREDWLVQRLTRTVADGFGHAPCVDNTAAHNRQAVITAGLTEADQRCLDRAEIAGPAPATDDHPFVYLRTRAVPGFYLWTLLGILVLSLIAVRAIGGPMRRMWPYGDLFLLGAAFLLLETRSITGFALLFGTTWIVNAIVFAGVLLVVLLAVETTRRWRTPPMPVMYAALGGSLLLAALVPPGSLLGLAVPVRGVLAVGIAFLPVYLANLVFSKRFEGTMDPTAAFGANLLGAMVGGCLEYASLITGYQSLLAIAALLYAGAFVLLRRNGSRPGILSA